MCRKDSPSAKKGLIELIKNYEAAKAKGQPIYLDGDQLADIANWYAIEQKFAEAQEVITYGLHLHPQSTDLLIEQAYLYLDTQNLQKAKKVAATITEEYNCEVKILKAELLFNEGKLEEAQKLLNSIEDVDELVAFINIVEIFLGLGYPESAREWLEKGKKRYAKELDYIVLTADYLFVTHQYEASAKIYNQLIDKDPYNTSYWMKLAKIHFIEENIDQAIEACDFALAANENCGEAYAYKAYCFFYLNNADKAIENYQKAITYKSIPPGQGYMFIGLSYANKEEWQKADEYYTKAIDCFEKEEDSNPILLMDTYTNKAYAISHLERYEEAHQLCDKAKELDPNEGFNYLTDGKIYLAEEKEDQAAEAFEKAIEINPDVSMYYMVASTYSENKYLYEAKEYYEMVYQLDPKYESVAEKLSIISLINNRIDDFFKYNNECKNPLGVDGIEELLATPNHSAKDEKTLKEVLKRMKRENKKKRK